MVKFTLNYAFFLTCFGFQTSFSTDPCEFGVLCLALEKHNELRSLHSDTPCMTMTAELNQDAQSWADTASQDYNAHSGYMQSVDKHQGENVAFYWKPWNNVDEEAWIRESIEEVTQNWYNEGANYVYETGRSAGRHFAQVVWDESVKLGVGWALSDCDEWANCKRIVIVARYLEKGNYGWSRDPELSQFVVHIQVVFLKI